jgi:hypothetical protein
LKIAVVELPDLIIIDEKKADLAVVQVEFPQKPLQTSSDPDDIHRKPFLSILN